MKPRPRKTQRARNLCHDSMKQMNRPYVAWLCRVAVFAVACLLAAPPALAQQQTVGAPGSPLPYDGAVTVGTLPNGMRYYIRENHKPEKRAELRLVVNAGSVLEDENQRGLAHMVEHMAISGPKQF